MAMPNAESVGSVSGGPIRRQMGRRAPAACSTATSLPLQRIPPQYPRDAARSGITGWVQLEVLVNADGSVRSARVLEAKPQGMFEASAVQAVMRWKFKPKSRERQARGTAGRAADRVQPERARRDVTEPIDMKRMNAWRRSSRCCWLLRCASQRRSRTRRGLRGRSKAAAIDMSEAVYHDVQSAMELHRQEADTTRRSRS